MPDINLEQTITCSGRAGSVTTISPAAAVLAAAGPAFVGTVSCEPTSPASCRPTPGSRSTPPRCRSSTQAGSAAPTAGPARRGWSPASAGTPPTASGSYGFAPWTADRPGQQAGARLGHRARGRGRAAGRRRVAGRDPAAGGVAARPRLRRPGPPRRGWPSAAPRSWWHPAASSGGGGRGRRAGRSRRCATGWRPPSGS
jgi:hypothetical protein